MNLWRVRCTLPDRPGALAALARECGAARVNILGLQIFPGVEIVTDELVLHVPEDWGLVDIAGLIESAGGTSVSGTPCTEHALVDQPMRYVLAARTILAQPASFPEVVAGLFDAEADPVDGALDPVQDVIEMTVGDVAVQVRRTAALHAHRARPRHRDGRPGQRRPRPQPRRVRAPASAARTPGRQQLRPDVRRLRRAGGRARRGHHGRGGPAGRTRGRGRRSSPSRWTWTRPGGAAGIGTRLLRGDGPSRRRPGRRRDRPQHRGGQPGGAPDRARGGSARPDPDGQRRSSPCGSRCATSSRCRPDRRGTRLGCRAALGTARLARRMQAWSSPTSSLPSA